MSGFPALEVAAGLLAGLVLGGVYFALLYRAVQLVAAAETGGTAVTLHALRVVLAAGAFWLLAQLGAAALLSGLAGFLIARTLARRRVGAP